MTLSFSIRLSTGAGIFLYLFPTLSVYTSNIDSLEKYMESCRGTYIKAFLVWLKAVVSGRDFSYALTVPAGRR